MAITTYRMNYCLECTAGFGVYVDGVHCKDAQIDTDRVRLTRADIAYATPIALDLANGSFQRVADLTAAITISPPVNMVQDDILKIVFEQDGTGGWDITFNAVFHGAYSNTGNTANKYCVIQYHYTGSVWLMDYTSGWFA